MYKHNVAPSYVPKASSTQRVTPTAYDVALLIATTARHVKVLSDGITGQAQDTETRHARAIVAYLLREDGGITWTGIGRTLGRDKSTALVLHRRIADKVAFRDWPTRATLQAIRHEVPSAVDHSVVPAVDHSVVPAVERSTTLADQYEARYWYSRALRDARERAVAE